MACRSFRGFDACGWLAVGADVIDFGEDWYSVFLRGAGGGRV